MAAAILTMIQRVAPAEAHAFGTRYDLPLPLDFYLAGAGATVALSFVVMVLVFRARPALTNRLQIDMLRLAPMRFVIHPLLIGVLQVVSVGLFLLVLATGFFGVSETLENFAPTFIWIIWWVGLAYVVALLGNLWPAINPWSIVFTGVETLVRLIRPGARLDLGLAYPTWLGVWPAVALFGVFAWFELIYEGAKVPSTLATFILIYSVLTWLGMAAFGRAAWLARGEAFSLAFAVLGRFAPIDEPQRDSPGGPARHWYLRPFAGGLVVERPCGLSTTVFVLLILSTVTFDGFRETPIRANLLEWIAVNPWFRFWHLKLHQLGFDLPVALDVVTLALFPVLFFLIFFGFSWLAKEFSEIDRPVTEIAGLFVFSLVPIAIAYHLAHYLSYLLISGQHIILLASDPFGFGWNLFGTVGYDVDFAIVGAKFVWRTAVVAIVAGHVFAVGVAHFVALRFFDSAAAAFRSQIPFLVLMVAYTVSSLWIISQPIIEGPRPSVLRSPSGTLSLAPYEFREFCIEMTAGEEVRYDFRSNEPIEFDIHYHQGSTIRFPLQLKGSSGEANTFVAGSDQSYCLTWANQSIKGITLSYRVFGP